MPVKDAQGTREPCPLSDRGIPCAPRNLHHERYREKYPPGAIHHQPAPQAAGDGPRASGEDGIHCQLCNPISETEARDLLADPSEKHNIAAEQPDVVADLLKTAAEHKASFTPPPSHLDARVETRPASP